MKNKYFVYYKDGYYDDGGLGLHEAESKEDAESFIAERLEKSEKPDLKDYVVVLGQEVQLQVAQVVSKVKIGG